MLGRALAWRPSATAVRRSFLAALVMNTVIVVTGGAVRLTASGLGCPTVPRCTAESMVATREMGVHGAIEFGNRLLTFVLTAAVLAALVTAVRAGRRDLAGRAGVLTVGIMAQALLGAVTVLTGLDPATVMTHFLLSMVLIAVAVSAYERAAAAPPSTDRPSHVRREVRALAILLTLAVAATLAVGTVVTGTGPHSGDKDATDRFPLDLESVTQLHADLVFLVLGLTLGLLVAVLASDAPDPMPRRVGLLLGLVLAQGLVGFVQYATDLPVVLVGMHVLGACLVWIATLRVLLATDPRVRPGLTPASPAESRPEPAWATGR